MLVKNSKWRLSGLTSSGEHVYLSIGCLHGNHEYCQEAVKADGSTKAPAECKFCSAGCICDCHGEERREEQADEVDLAAGDRP